MPNQPPSQASDIWLWLTPLLIASVMLDPTVPLTRRRLATCPTMILPAWLMRSWGSSAILEQDT